MFAIESLRYPEREIGGVDDVVTLEHRPRFPTAQLHDRRFVDTRAAEVARRGATQVVNQASRHAGVTFVVAGASTREAGSAALGLLIGIGVPIIGITLTAPLYFWFAAMASGVATLVDRSKA